MLIGLSNLDVKAPMHMTEPAYVAIAGEYARRIRNRELPPGTQLPSYAEIAERHEVSDIVVRKAIDLLRNQGLVRSIRRRGVFVADRPLESRAQRTDEDITAIVTTVAETRGDVKWLKRAVQILLDHHGLSVEPEPDD